MADPNRTDNKQTKIVREDVDHNADPITDQHGAHPVGTGVGATGIGAAATAVGGAVGGPVGAVAGAVVGGIAGGLAGKGIAETIDPTVEEAHWKETYQSRPYYQSGYSYDDYFPAYRTGYEGYGKYASQGLSYDQAEPHLRSRYEMANVNSRLSWQQASPAAQDAWLRVAKYNA